MKKVSRLAYYFLFILLLAACQNSKKNSDLKQIKRSADSYDELVKLIVSVPMCEKPYYFDSFAHADDVVGFGNRTIELEGFSPNINDKKLTL